MATSLQGLFQTPAQASLGREALGIKLGQLDPLMVSTAVAYGAGSGLGKGLGGMMGLQTDEDRLRVLQQEFSDIDINDPAQLRMMGQRLMSEGFGQEGMTVLDRADDLYESQTSRITALKRSKEKAGTMEQYMDTAAAMVENPDGTLGCDWRTDTACMQKAKVIAEEFKSSTPAEKAQSKYATEVAKGTAEADIEIIKSAPKAVDAIQKTNQVLDILDKGEAHTGFMAEFKTNISRVMALAGKDSSKDAASSTQLLQALLGSDVFPMIGQLGIGARGLDTPAEREFLLKVMTGDIGMEKDAIRKLTEIRQRISRNLIKKFNEKVDRGDFANYEAYTGRIVPKINLEGLGRRVKRPQGARKVASPSGEIQYLYPNGKIYTQDGRLVGVGQ